MYHLGSSVAMKMQLTKVVSMMKPSKAVDVARPTTQRCSGR